MFFHQVYTEYDTTVPTNQVMKMFASSYAHVVHVCSHYIEEKSR